MCAAVKSVSIRHRRLCEWFARYSPAVVYGMPICRFPWRVFQAAVPGHEYGARDDITLKITVLLPGPRAVEAHVPRFQHVMSDSPPHASAFSGQLSMPLMNAPIEVDTVSLPFLLSYSNSRDHRWKRRRSTRHIAIYVGSVMMYHHLWKQPSPPPPPPCLISRRESLHTLILTTFH
jgi:hypothetical protein